MEYPFIPNKKMYAAVMGACSYIRETGYFNKAVSYYADKYNVDKDELAKHVRARQSTGRKAKKTPSANKGKKLKYFAVFKWVSSGEGTERNISDIEILRGYTKKAVEGRYSDSDFKATMASDYGGYYSCEYWHEASEGFDTESEAVEYAKKYRQEMKQMWG